MAPQDLAGITDRTLDELSSHGSRSRKAQAGQSDRIDEALSAAEQQPDDKMLTNFAVDETRITYGLRRKRSIKS